MRLEVRPLRVRGARPGGALLPRRVGKAGSSHRWHHRGEIEFDRELRRLDQELLASQDVQSSALSELQAANEELEATSEELQSSSEELQSVERGAARPRTRSSRRPTSSSEPSTRSCGRLPMRAQRVNTDLMNIQSSVSQGMVIVDRDLRVIRFTPLAVRVFALVASTSAGPCCPSRPR